MGRRERYEPGVFCWVELMAADTDAARAFYGDLLGWDFEDGEGPGGMTYTTLRLDGDAVGGLYEQPPQQREAGAPPSWLSYVSTADVDATAARATQLGGALHAGPADILDLGRMAILGDPTGAMLGVWQPRGSIGAERVNDPGCLTWNDLSTSDVEAASRFYSDLFGWRISELDTGGGPRYWAIGHHGAAEGRNGGMRELAPEQEGVPPHWMPYFTVSSADRTVELAKAAGGAVHAGPMDIPTGRIAVLGDPQGAVFGIFEGDVDD